jgi:hypothetical protein
MSINSILLGKNNRARTDMEGLEVKWKKEFSISKFTKK